MSKPIECERHEMDVPPGCPGCVLEMLKNLLALIHGDGGHHTEWVGIKQSVEDAMGKTVRKWPENEGEKS